MQDSRRDNPEAGYPEEFSCISLLVRDPQVTTIVQYYYIFFTVVEKQPSRKNVEVQSFLMSKISFNTQSSSYYYTYYCNTARVQFKFPLQVNENFSYMRIN